MAGGWAGPPDAARLGSGRGRLEGSILGGSETLGVVVALRTAFWGVQGETKKAKKTPLRVDTASVFFDAYPIVTEAFFHGFGGKPKRN